MSDLAEKILEACREEVANLWHDLRRAIENGINTNWSIQCEHVADRIEMLTRLVGPTSWEEIPIPLIEDGVYQRLHAEWGIEYPAIDMDRIAQVRASINERSTGARGYGVQP